MRPPRHRRVGPATVIVVAVALAVTACSGSGGSPDESAAEPTVQADDVAPVAALIVADDFAVASADLDDQRVSWRTIEGRWSVDDGTLVLRDAPEAFPSMAVTDVGGPDGVISVAMPEIVDGTGMVFRLRDQSNYWSLVAVPGFATWNLSKVENNERQLVANTGLSPIAAYTAIGVRLDGPLIQVTVDGRVRLEVTDPFLDDETTAGVTAEQTGVVQGRWDDFYAIGVDAAPSPLDAPTAATGSTTDASPSPEPAE